MSAGGPQYHKVNRHVHQRNKIHRTLPSEGSSLLCCVLPFEIYIGASSGGLEPTYADLHIAYCPFLTSRALDRYASNYKYRRIAFKTVSLCVFDDFDNNAAL